MTKIRKHSSKRNTLRKQYSVAKKVRMHHKKVKKEIRTMKKSGAQKPLPKTMGIPNSHPEKAKMLDEMEYNEKMRAEARKQGEALKKAIKQMPQGILESYAEEIHAKVLTEDFKDLGKLTDAEIKEAERLMELTGEIDINARQSQGPSRRAFYKELKKVLDASDVVLQVLDARDPEGCRSEDIEAEVLKSGKKLIQILNKIDLVPSQNARQWQRYLSKEHPVFQFKANYQGPVANKAKEDKLKTQNHIKTEDPTEQMTEELLKILKKHARLLKSEDKPVITVGVVGFPNVGKSSIINALRKSRATVVNHLPGTTKVMQEIILDKSILALDCPGVIPTAQEETNGLVLRQAIKVDELVDVIGPVEALLAKVQMDDILKLYHIAQYKTTEQMLTQLAKKKAALRAGGQANIDDAARTVLRDFLNGKIRFFTPAPSSVVHASDDEEMN